MISLIASLTTNTYTFSVPSRLSITVENVDTNVLSQNKLNNNRLMLMLFFNGFSRIKIEH